jgi:hypothetical protein
MIKTKLLLVGTLSLLSLHLSAAGSIFTSDFDGTADWNFDSKVDPNGQIGGTNQFTYTGAATDGNAYLTKNINISEFTTSKTGTLVLSGSLDVSNMNFGNNDHSKRSLISIGTIDGNKNGFDNTGTIFNFDMGGYTNEGEFTFTQLLGARYASGGYQNLTVGVPTGIMDFEITITVDGDNATGWVLSQETSITNTFGGATMVMSSTWSRADSNFDGIQDINRIQVGFNGGTYGMDEDEYLIIDDLALSMIPEPSTYGILSALTVFVFVCGQRRRS